MNSYIDNVRYSVIFGSLYCVSSRGGRQRDILANANACPFLTISIVIERETMFAARRIAQLGKIILLFSISLDW